VDLEAHLCFTLANALSRLELPIARQAYSGADLSELDVLMDALLPVSELRAASRSIGRSFLRAATRLRVCDVAAEHHAVVFGAVLRAWALPLDDGLEMYAFQAVRQQLSAAQRLGKIGQSALQAQLHRLKPEIASAVAESRSVDREMIGSFSPLVDLAAMTHARQHARLFLS
jgi:urease accessory protein